MFSITMKANVPHLLRIVAHPFGGWAFHAATYMHGFSLQGLRMGYGVLGHFLAQPCSGACEFRARSGFRVKGVG